MGDVHYLISEAAKQLQVESHVLRYWEEELALPIGRTEMGHRHYTEDDIQLFSCIKELKEQGMQLKEIKEIIPDMLRAKQVLKARRLKARQTADTDESAQDSPAKDTVGSDTLSQSTLRAESADSGDGERLSQAGPAAPETDREEAAPPVSTSLSMEQICALFGSVVADAMRSNNQILEEHICREVTSKISTNMDFLLRAKERQEDDRFRRLDHLIRQQQASRRETARLTPARYLHRIFGEN